MPRTDAASPSEPGGGTGASAAERVHAVADIRVDTFTEPSADPATLRNPGPLAGLWLGEHVRSRQWADTAWSPSGASVLGGCAAPSSGGALGDGIP